jgi:hypothetical protein
VNGIASARPTLGVVWLCFNVAQGRGSSALRERGHLPHVAGQEPASARKNRPRLARVVRFRSLVLGAAQRECQQLPQMQGIVLFGTIDAFVACGRPFKVNSA